MSDRPDAFATAALAPGLLAVAALAAFLPSAAEALTPLDRQRLGSGETIVRWEPPPNGDAAGEDRTILGLRLLDAAPERVFRAVTDYRHYAEFMPFLVTSEVLDGDADSAEVRQVIQPPFPARRRECRVILRSDARQAGEGRWLASWDLAPGSGAVSAPASGSGPVRRHRGDWTLSRYDGGRTLVAFRWSYDPGGGLPRSLAEKAVERSVPWVLDGLRQQVQRCRYDDPQPPGCNDG